MTDSTLDLLRDIDAHAAAPLPVTIIDRVREEIDAALTERIEFYTQVEVRVGLDGEIYADLYDGPSDTWITAGHGRTGIAALSMALDVVRNPRRD